MFKTFILTISCVLISASFFTNLIPDDKIKPFARLGISFVILAVFMSSVLSLGNINMNFFPETTEETTVYQDNLKEVFEDNIEKDILAKYDVKAEAEVSISEEKTIELEQLVLYDKKHVEEIKNEYKPKEIVVN